MHKHGLCRHAVSVCVYSHLVCDPHNPATRFRPPSATVVSAELFSHRTGTLRCLQKEMATYRLCACGETQTMPTLSTPVPWQNWMAAYLGYTLRMKTLFRGRPVMVHDTHTTRRRRLTDTKHVATSLREQSYLFQSVNLPRLSEWRGRSFCHAVCLNRITDECVNGRRPNVVGMGKEWLSRSD